MSAAIEGKKLEKKPVKFSYIQLGPVAMKSIIICQIATFSLEPALTCSKLRLWVSRWRSPRPPWLPTEATASLVL
jgi:hypothetical protein